MKFKSTRFVVLSNVAATRLMGRPVVAPPALIAIKLLNVSPLQLYENPLSPASTVATGVPETGLAHGSADAGVAIHPEIPTVSTKIATAERVPILTVLVRHASHMALINGFAVMPIRDTTRCMGGRASDMPRPDARKGDLRAIYSA